MISILNIFNDQVIAEGPAGGFSNDKGNAGLARMYQVRKGLQDAESYIDRIKLSFG